MTDLDLDAIEARAAAATPGPWHWAGNTATKWLTLSTWKKGLGRCTVMDFTRWGMQGARPRFADGDLLMHDADELARYEVCHDAKSADDPRVYRHDIDAINHPDAEFIVHARQDVTDLLALVKELLAELDGRDEEARERWIQKVLAETALKSMDFRKGASMELEPAKDLVAHWVAAARALLAPDGVEAPNYTETVCEFTQAGEFERYAFIVQRVAHDKLTPHQARRKAERRADKAEAALTLIASRVCETSTRGRCDDTRTPEAEYGAERTCDPCIARATLTEQATTR